MNNDIELQIDVSVLMRRKEEQFPLVQDKDFASWLGVTPSTFSDYKNTRKTMPSLPVALRAAIILNMDLRDLVINPDQIKKCVKSVDNTLIT